MLNTESISDILEFLKKHERLILGLNPYNCHAMIGFYLTENKSEEYNSCFWIPPLLCDILKLKAPEKGKIVELDDLKPGNYYYLELYSHHLSILYIASDIIYVVDYYDETNRSEHFRVKLINEEELSRFQNIVKNKDIEGYADFHEGDEEYRELLYYYRNRSKNFELVERVYEQPLNYDVGIEDVFRPLYKPSFPLEEYDYTEEDFETEPKMALPRARVNKKLNLIELEKLYKTSVKDINNSVIAI